MTRKILILVANSKNTSREQFGEQVREIENALQRAKNRDQFELVAKWAVRPRDIHRAMLDLKPHIVHFLGRAARFQGRELEDGSDSEGLVFEDENGQAKPVSGEALAVLFGLFADALECVVINNCYSKEQAEEIVKCIPYVIGTKQAISDKAALDFAVGFYDALGAGRSVEFAFHLGCSAIQMAGIPENLTPVLHREKFFLRPDIVKKNSELKSLEDHYQSIIQAITRNRMVPFLGSDINLCDRAVQINRQLEHWNPDCPYPPSGKEIAAYFARTFPPQLEKIIRLLYKQEGRDEQVMIFALSLLIQSGLYRLGSILLQNYQQETKTKTGELPEKYPLINELIHEHAILIYPDSKGKGSLHIGGDALQYLSQYAFLTRESEFYEELQQVELGCEPNQLHNFFASLLAIMREKGYYPPYPLIVTTNYDCALEEAFKRAGEPFDLVFYSNIIEEGKLDRFIHRTPEDKFIDIEEPNKYDGFSFEQRPVILKLYGTADQIREREGESVVITEEHYIEYLVTRKIANLLPVQLLKKLRGEKPNLLFLGYPLGDWNQRIILHRIWPNLTFRKRYPWCAIQSNVDPLAQKLWHSYDVVLYDIPLRDYISELKQRVLDIPVKGDKGYE